MTTKTLLQRLEIKYLSPLEIQYLTPAQKWQMITYEHRVRRGIKRDREAISIYRQHCRDNGSPYDILSVPDRLDDYKLSEDVKIMIYMRLSGG